MRCPHLVLPLAPWRLVVCWNASTIFCYIFGYVESLHTISLNSLFFRIRYCSVTVTTHAEFCVTDVVACKAVRARGHVKGPVEPTINCYLSSKAFLMRFIGFVFWLLIFHSTGVIWFFRNKGFVLSSCFPME